MTGAAPTDGAAPRDGISARGSSETHPGGRGRPALPSPRPDTTPAPAPTCFELRHRRHGRAGTRMAPRALRRRGAGRERLEGPDSVGAGGSAVRGQRGDGSSL